MNVIPQIQSLGLPPRQHADRVTGAMLHWIVRERESRWQRYWAEWERGSIGNPLGQQRMVKRMREAGGQFLLYIRLDPGKRARFKLWVCEVSGWDPTLNAVIDAKSPPPPDKPWLAVVSTLVDWRGSHREPEIRHGPIILVTHHSLSRLAQRCGARTPSDLLVATRALLDAAGAASIRPDELSCVGRRLAIALPDHMGDAVAVIVKHDDPEILAMVVATILDPEMV